MKKIKITCFSFSRSEFGLMKNLLFDLKKDKRFILNLIIGGSHVSQSFGKTIKEIKESKIRISKALSTKIDNSSSLKICSFLSRSTKEISKMLFKDNPDIILIMGDRYELLPLVNVSSIYNIPIAHISGGELTEGAIDDNIRHAVTKFSHLHFVANEEFKNRVKQLGEEEWRIKISGEPGVEKISNIKKISKKKIKKEIFDISKSFAIVTFHPVTNEMHLLKKQVENLLKSLINANFSIIFTGSNADLGGDYINKKIRFFCKKNKNCKFFLNLGFERYHNLLRYAKILIGNSSSGIVEGASYNLPVVNIGNRQKGRPTNKNVFHSGYDVKSIKNKINQALKFNMKVENIYYKKNSSKIIRDKIFKEITTKKKNFN